MLHYSSLAFKKSMRLIIVLITKIWVVYACMAQVSIPLHVTTDTTWLNAIPRSAFIVFPSIDTLTISASQDLTECKMHYLSSQWIPTAFDTLLINLVFAVDGGRIAYFGVDEDRNGVIMDQELKLFNDKGINEFKILADTDLLPFEIHINESLSQSIDELGTISLEPKYLLQGSTWFMNRSWNIIMCQNLFGATIYCDSMYREGVKLESVCIGEGFNVLDGRYEFYRNDDQLNIRELSTGERFRGFNVGCFVHFDSLCRMLDIEPTAQLIGLYFWGGWCYPCVQKFPKTVQYGLELEKTGLGRLYFITCNFFDSHIPKSIKVLEQYHVDSNLIRYPTSLKPSYDNKVENYESLNALFNIFSYPTLVIIRQDGKILYRGNEVPVLDDKFLSEVYR